jgi:small subunit ribosomal protein S5
MPEMIDESSSLESTTVVVNRTSATTKGGKRFQFNALVVVGDRRGKVGFGYAKSTEVPAAVEKAQKYARRTMLSMPMAGTTVTHEVEGRFSSSKVRLIPASPGTGVVAGSTVRAILEMAGITDCLTKCYGSTNQINVVKAVFDGIGRLRTRQAIAGNRGVELALSEIENRIERGKAFMPATTGKEKMRGPVNTMGQERRGGRGGGGRRRDRGPDSGGGQGGGPQGGGGQPPGSGGAKPG